MKTPISILFFIENLQGGGAEKVLCNLVNAMDQRRFSITVQTLWKENPEQYLKPWIRYRYCYTTANKLRRFRSRVEAALRLTYRLHIKDDYDIEVAYLECGSTKIMASSTNPGAKKIAWVHCDLQRKMTDLQSFTAKAKKWYQAYDRIVCVSESVRESFVKLFGNREKTAVLFNTIDDVAIRQRAETMLPEMPQKRRLTVVTVGRLSPEKAFDRLLLVHKMLLKQGVDHDLWIVGEGPERIPLESFIVTNDLSDSVKLLGFCTNPYPIMKAADLLVCSSYFEGFSTFVTEGMILGKPVVTTDCAGMRELLNDGKCGMIVDNKEQALMAGLRIMLEDSALREQYATLAKRRGNEFSAKLLTKQTERFLQTLIED